VFQSPGKNIGKAIRLDFYFTVNYKIADILINANKGTVQAVESQCRRDHPTPSSAEIKEKVDLCIYYPSDTSWPVSSVNFNFHTSVNN
jgi:hypothetical protein